MRIAAALLLFVVTAVADEIDAAADAVVEAASDAEALRRLAEKHDPDPWLVADELWQRGKQDLALAFAKAAPRHETKALPAYLAERKRAAELLALGRRSLGATNMRRVRAEIKSTGKTARELVRFYEEASEQAKKLGWHRGRGFFLNHASGFALFGERDVETAERLGRLALENARAGTDKDRVAAALHNLAMAAQHRGDLATAVRLLEQSLPLARSDSDRANTLYTLGQALLQAGRLADAKLRLEQALPLAEREKELQITTWIRGALGKVAAYSGDRDGAIRELRAALAISRRLGNHSVVAKQQTTLAHVLAPEFPVEALQLARSALAFWRKEDERMVPDTLLTVSHCLWSVGELAAAYRASQEAIHLARRLGMRTWMMEKTAADHLLALGRYSAALSLYDRVLAALDREPKDPARGHRQAAVWLEKAVLFFSVRDFGAAEKALQRVAAIERVGPDQAASLHRLTGKLHLVRHQYDLAIEAYTRALKASRALRWNVTSTLAGMADAYLRLGKHEKALACLKEAATQARLPHERSSVLGGMANVKLAAGDREEAIRLYKEAVLHARKLGMAKREFTLLGNLARALYLDGKAMAAAKVARDGILRLGPIVQGFGTQRGASAREQVAHIASTGMMSSRTAMQFCFFAEHARAGALLESLGARQRLRDVAVPEHLRLAEGEIRGRERAALRRYQQALQKGEGYEAAWKQLQAVRDEVVEITARIQREGRQRAALIYPRIAGLAAIRATLREGEALVMFLEGFKQVVALVVDREQIQVVKMDPLESISRLVTSFSSAASRPNERGVVRPPHESAAFLARKLREKIIEPLGLGKGIRRLLVSPTGQLAYLPLGLLTDREVVYVPSGTVLKLLRDSQSGTRGQRVLSLGDVRHESPLPASGREAESIGDVVLLGDKATRRELESALKTSPRWRSIHLATHGVVDPQRPVLNSLALTGGPLRCLDIYRMNIPADLAVLSACETGKGKVYKAEGVVGFVRAFMFAGCPRVLVSVWKVDDEATAALMKKFYELWKGGDVEAATALKKAQEFVKSQPKWKHPYYWAAWQLWGLGE